MKYILLHSSKMLLVISLSVLGCEHDKDYIDLNKNSKKDIYEDPLIPAIDRAKDLMAESGARIYWQDADASAARIVADNAKFDELNAMLNN